MSSNWKRKCHICDLVFLSNILEMSAQVSSVQDTPELLGFLRNTSTSHQRHRRAVSSSQGSIGKTLVSFVFSFVLSRGHLWMTCGGLTCVPVCPAELHQRLLSEDHVSGRPAGSASECRGENPLQTLGANIPAGQDLTSTTLSFFSQTIQ